MTDRPTPVEVMLNCGLIWLDANRCLDALEQHGYRIVHESELRKIEDIVDSCYQGWPRWDEARVWFETHVPKRGYVEGWGEPEVDELAEPATPTHVPDWATEFEEWPPPQPGTHESDLWPGVPVAPSVGQERWNEWSVAQRWSRANRSQTT